MTYVPGSAEPPASYQDRTLRWELENVRAGLELRYRLQPQEVGTWPTNVEARSRYTDGHEVPGELVFPVPSVVVVGPALPIYLPVAARLYCVPAKQHADVVLVLDTSSTMTGDKLASAKAAARRFLEVLHLPDDHAAVVSFSRQATLGAGLTGGRAALQDAIDGLAVIPGTAIDAGLRLAIDELGAHGRPDATHAIVLMTDGLNNDGRQPVLDAADSAHRRQVVLYTVAFGVDADVELMREVAGNPRRSFLALTGEDLIRIYTEIAGVIPCP
jgi:uncharacterized protein YegL